MFCPTLREHSFASFIPCEDIAIKCTKALRCERDAAVRKCNFIESPSGFVFICAFVEPYYPGVLEEGVVVVFVVVWNEFVAREIDFGVAPCTVDLQNRTCKYLWTSVSSHFGPLSVFSS